MLYMYMLVFALKKKRNDRSYDLPTVRTREYELLQ